MAQPITNLPVGTCIKMMETINGESYTRPWIILAQSDTNPYGSDKVFCLRKQNTNQGQNTYLATKNYENTSIHTKISVEFQNRFSQKTLSHIAISTIKCAAPSSHEEYTLAEKFFAPSTAELNSKREVDPSSVIPFFSSNAQRVGLNEDGSTGLAATYLTRIPADTYYYIINRSGATQDFNTASSIRPACNILSTTLVSNTPDENGYYNLIEDPSQPYLFVYFDCSLGTVARRPLKIHLDLATEGNPEITSLQVCNNYGDTTPTWENITIGEKHTFTNTTKTSDDWEIGVKVDARGENTIKVYEPFAIVQTQL